MKKFILILFLFATLIGNQARATTAACTGALGSYTGNSSTTVFPYTCRLLASSDIKVLVNNVVQTLSTHYSVSSVGSSSGNITFVTAPVTGATIRFIRNLAITQSSVYKPNEAFPATRVETDYDRQTMISQMLAEKLTRALVIPEGSTVTPTLPAPEASKYLRWNAAATGIENADGTTSAPNTELLVAAAGVWTNTQHNTSGQIVVNGMDFSTAYADEQGGNHGTDGLTVAVKVPNGSTVYGAHAIAGFIDSLDASTIPVAGYFQARSKVNGANIFSLNTLMSDEGFTGVQMQNELDFSVSQTGTIVHGLTFKGISSAEPTTSAAIIIDKLDISATSNAAWQYLFFAAQGSFMGAGINFDAGAPKAGTEPSIQLGPIATANNSSSQYITFIGKDSGGVFRTAQMRADANGAVAIRSGKNGEALAFQDFNSGSGTNLILASTTAIDLYPTGSPKVRLEADGQLLINSASASGTEVVLAKQRTNNDDTLILQRLTDSTPTGNFIKLVNAANDAALFQIDVTGTITRTNNAVTISATKTVRDAAGTGTCTLIFTGGLLSGGTC